MTLDVRAIIVQSLPMGERGLKLRKVMTVHCAIIVAPYGGAWLETLERYPHPAWLWSLPMGERGLKHRDIQELTEDKEVAPYGGAWIETSIGIYPSTPRPVAPYGGAWIETSQASWGANSPASRSLWGSVD